MKQFTYFPVLMMLILLPQFCLAQGYSVDASSHNWMAQRDYSEAMIADDDPATTWAEGGTGAGEGEWVSFTFDSPINLARIGVRNGDQREGDWESCNRVRELRLEIGNGREIMAELKDQPGLQYVDINGENVTTLKATIQSIHKADNMWNRSVTCLSDIIFEAYLDPAQMAAVAAEPSGADEPLAAEPDKLPEAVTPAPTRPEVVLKPVVLPETGPVDSKPLDPANVVGDSKPSDTPVVEPAAEPMADPAAAAMATVREYYNRLNTLDPSFPDLMAAEIQDQETLSFYYFEEIQKQLGTADILRDSEVDLSGLTISIDKLYERFAHVMSKGYYTIATPGQKLMVDENARFDLVIEDEQWKIQKRVEE